MTTGMTPAQLGAQGSALHDTLAGLTDGVTSIVAMLKGEGMPAPGPGAPGDEEPGDDMDGGGMEPGAEGEEEKEAGEGGAYEDLEQGVIVGANGEEFVDGTVLLGALVQELAKANQLNGQLANELTLLRQGRERDRRKVVDLSKAVATTNTALAQITEQVLAPMAKAVTEGAGLGGRAGAPATRRAATSPAATAVRRHVGSTGPAQPPGAQEFSSEDLMKALVGGVLTETQVRVFKRFGKFDTDDATNNKLAQAVRTTLAA